MRRVLVELLYYATIGLVFIPISNSEVCKNEHYNGKKFAVTTIKVLLHLKLRFHCLTNFIDKHILTESFSRNTKYYDCSNRCDRTIPIKHNGGALEL